jgi:hypothetical protein
MTRLLSHASVRLASLVGVVVLPVFAIAAHAQQQPAADVAILAQEHYITPPPEVARLVTAARQTNVTLTQPSPDRHHFLALHTGALGSEQQFGKPHYYLGGLQVDYRANRARTLTTRGLANIEIVDAQSGAKTAGDSCRRNGVLADLVARRRARGVPRELR